ncbi:MAG: hypothetical protein R3323_05625 [Wenzhouxiangellaceae bacterium]|nr:hypothetical protein [Wenzhouxiangellaceae bacterium]
MSEARTTRACLSKLAVMIAAFRRLLVRIAAPLGVLRESGTV